ncbi:MAG TPA: phosphoribosylanthranilate isomerase [Pyrinomonadaceae bacterium]|nr:phosphoribosylanthranilate isomerase [Pyrinomonadaceae bacterium]
MVRVKVCGITDVEDAKHAATCGADEIGLNFYSESPRCVSMRVAQEVANSIDASVKLVGVFVNADEREIALAAKQCGLDAVQLHGDETLDFARKIAHENSVRVIRAVEAKQAIRILNELKESGLNLLIDAPSMGAYGGTGSVSDWNLAADAAASFDRVYLAGGLGPDNVATAIRKVRPFCVDACSKLESIRGKKDPKKVAAFIEAAKNVL